jgi:hypothetical protein
VICTLSSFSYTFDAAAARWAEVRFVLHGVKADGAVVLLQELEPNRSRLVADGTAYSVRNRATVVGDNVEPIYSVVVSFRHSRGEASAASSEHTLAWVDSHHAGDASFADST